MESPFLLQFFKSSFPLLTMSETPQVFPFKVPNADDSHHKTIKWTTGNSQIQVSHSESQIFWVGLAPTPLLDGQVKTTKHHRYDRTRWPLSLSSLSLYPFSGITRRMAANHGWCSNQWGREDDWALGQSSAKTHCHSLYGRWLIQSFAKIAKCPQTSRSSCLILFLSTMGNEWLRSLATQ